MSNTIANIIDIDYQKLDVSNKKILTRHKNNYDWVSSKIIKFFNCFLEVELVEDYLEKVLMLDDMLECKFSIDEETIHVIRAQVYNVKISTRSVVLKIQSTNTFTNTRNSKRYDVCYYSVFSKENQSNEYYSVVSNISTTGIGLITNRRLEKDSIITVSVYFPKFNIATLTCKIRWTDPLIDNKVQYGAEIIDSDEFEREKFDAHLNFMQNNFDLFNI